METEALRQIELDNRPFEAAYAAHLAKSRELVCRFTGQAETYSLEDPPTGGILQHDVAVADVQCTSANDANVYNIWVRVTFQQFDPDEGAWADIAGTVDFCTTSVRGDGYVPCVSQQFYDPNHPLANSLRRAKFELLRPILLPPRYSRLLGLR